MQFWTCPYCGANLDPGERCDCKKEMPPRVRPTPQAASGNSFSRANVPHIIVSKQEKKSNDLHPPKD